MALSDRLTITLPGDKGLEHGHYLTVNLNKISASFPIMAAVKISTPSTSSYSFFKILKDGALLPARNRGLFAAVFALSVAYTSLLLLVNHLLADLDILTCTDEVIRDVMAFTNVTDATSPDEFDQLFYDLGSDTWSLVRAVTANLFVNITVGNAVWIVALFAAVATYAGEKTSSFGAVLGKAWAQLKGTALTVAFVFGLKVTYVALLLSAMAALLVIDFVKGPSELLLLLGCLLFLAAVLFFQYFTFVCELSVVAAVAEPGQHSASAVVRAWRLLRGRKWTSVLFIAVVKVLAFACYRAANALASTRVGTSQASGLLMKLLYGVSMDAVQLFAVCAITAFYYECKEHDDDSATEFIKLPSEEFICA